METQRALIIEDDPDTAGFFRTVLTLAGFTCDSVHTAREALNWLATGSPKLILLDMRLGLEISGADILYQVRTNPRFDNTHVIVITAYQDLAQPIASLADLVLMKPVSVDQLKTLAERVGTLEIAPRRVHFRDPVTKLYNQEFFYTRLELAFERFQRRADYCYGVVAMRIQPADEGETQLEPEAFVSLLQQIASRLLGSLRAVDSISRFSGWKFAVLLEDLQEPQAVKVVLNRLRESLSQPYRVDDVSYDLRVGLGAAVCNDTNRGAEEVLATAEQALEWAISSGRPAVYVLAATPEALA